MGPKDPSNILSSHSHEVYHLTSPPCTLNTQQQAIIHPSAWVWLPGVSPAPYQSPSLSQLVCPPLGHLPQPSSFKAYMTFQSGPPQQLRSLIAPLAGPLKPERDSKPPSSQVHLDFHPELPAQFTGLGNPSCSSSAFPGTLTPLFTTAAFWGRNWESRQKEQHVQMLRGVKEQEN